VTSTLIKRISHANRLVPSIGWKIGLKYDSIRAFTVKIRPFTEKNAPYTVSVLLRISPYTVTETYDRNTEPCNTPKYGRIRSVYIMYTVVYGAVYGRLRAFTHSVFFVLGAM
jgi:hypothetical protein